MTDLGTLGGTSSLASDINPSGQVVGTSQTAGRRGCSRLSLEEGVMTDLGTLGGCCSSAAAINPAGQVVGESQTAEEEPPRLSLGKGRHDRSGHSRRRFQHRPRYQSRWESGGSQHPYGRGGFLPALSLGQGVMAALGFSGVVEAIDPAGLLVGWSFTSDGFTHATLWTRK
jgi:uncharacterized membrane protein